MKTAICTIAIFAIAFATTFTVQAGSVPEDLLSPDARIFFGEIVSHDAATGNVTVVPQIAISGNVTVGTQEVFARAEAIGSATIPSDRALLMAFYEENNPLWVFRTTSFDTATLQIEGIAGQDMWQRFQSNLNEGLYGHAGIARNGDVSPMEVDGVHPDIMPIMGEFEDITDEPAAATRGTPDIWLSTLIIVGFAMLIVFLRRLKK